MTTRNMLVRNTFWLGLVEGFSKVIMFGVTVSLVRYLGPKDFGTYNLAFSYVAMFMILSDFGLNSITSRDVAKHKDLTEKYLSNLLGLKLTLSLVITILTITSFFVLPTSGTRLMILSVLAYNLIQNIESIFIAIFSAWERMELVFFTRISYYLGILVSAVSVIYFHGSAMNIVSAYGITTLLSVFLSISLVKYIGIKVMVSFDRSFWREMLIESIPMMGLAVVGVIYANNDTLLIGKLLGSTQVGFYQSAYKILFAFQSINVINGAISPRINVLLHEQKLDTLVKLIKIVVGLSILGLIPLATVITIFSKQIITIIYGSNFVSSAPVMSVLIWAGVVNFYRNLTGSLLFAQKRQKYILFSVMIGLVVNILINFSFIPQYGIITSAYALLISESVILVSTIISLKSHISSRFS